MNLTPDQHRIYFEARLEGQCIAATDKDVSVRCPFHDDRRASMSVNVERGVYHCHAGCGAGGVLDFEMKFSNCSAEVAWANIGEITGAPNQNFFSQRPEAVYPYTDEDGRQLFEKVRFAGKRFTQRMRDAGGKFTYRLDGVRRVLYHLPAVVRASDVIIVEGEKDADRVNALNLSGHPSAPRSQVIATTNFEGAGGDKWRPEYSAYMTGKHVVILPDHDAIGRDRGERIAKSVFPYAVDVRLVELPGLADHQDVSDYLDQHTADDLLAEICKVPFWKPEKGNLLSRRRNSWQPCRRKLIGPSRELFSAAQMVLSARTRKSENPGSHWI